MRRAYSSLMVTFTLSMLLAFAGLMCATPAAIAQGQGASSAVADESTATPDAARSVAVSSEASASSQPVTMWESKAKPKKPASVPKFIPRKGKAVYIDRKHQRVYLYVNHQQIDTFLCSTSRTLPRRGTYHMTGKRKQSWSFNGAVTFYWQVIFTVGPAGHNIAFHSVPVNGAGKTIAPLGKPVSHGCVRLQYKKAKFLYFWITKRTPIYVRP